MDAMELSRRDLLRGLAAVSGCALVAEASMRPSERATVEDFARARRVGEWLHHPAIGDPSWDSFQREPGNPIYVGSEPHVWPVNGTLFRDPVSNAWYAFVSVYPRGYFAEPRFDVRVLRERAPGEWEDLGLVFASDPPPYVASGDRKGGATDASVVFHEGRYHMLFGWADPANRRGGLGYAWAERPEGPYTPALKPLDDDAGRQPLLGRYVRSYASTLIRRRNDWLILHMMSTPGNAGGTWGLFARVCTDLEGALGEPVPLLLPQSDIFHPPLAEFFPAYVHAGRVYAPATSVAANRSYQSLFSAPLERAEDPKAWRLERTGSLWHAEPVPWEAFGIWGQTFAGCPFGRGRLRVLFPSKMREDVGTISMATGTVRHTLRDGFVLSGPNAPSVAILRRIWQQFRLTVRLEAMGDWRLCWGCAGPLGPNHHLADSAPHELMFMDRTELRFRSHRCEVVRVDVAGRETTLGSLARPFGDALHLRIEQEARRVRVRCGEEIAFEAPLEAQPGRIELIADRGGFLRVFQLSVTGRRHAYWEDWLAVEAMAGAASAPGEWQPTTGEQFLYGVGAQSAKEGVRAKWNFEGRRCGLIAPTGPQYGSARVLLDGREVAEVSFHASEQRKAHPILGVTAGAGRHALVLVAKSGNVPLDVLRVWR